MRFLSIDNYLADLNILVDDIGGESESIGLCPGRLDGADLAARFPGKVRKLTLAGARSTLPPATQAFAARAQHAERHLPRARRARRRTHLGQHAPRFWARIRPTRGDSRIVASSAAMNSPAFRRLETRFREWYAWTVDLPGTCTCKSSNTCSRIIALPLVASWRLAARSISQAALPVVPARRG
jgi:hypothetical protein